MLAYITGLDPDISSALASMSGGPRPAGPPARSRLPPEFSAPVTALRVAAHNNSAACYAQLGEWAASAAAATKAIGVQPRNAKALFRRAKATFTLGDAAAAEEDIVALEALYADAAAADTGVPATGDAPPASQVPAQVAALARAVRAKLSVAETRFNRGLAARIAQAQAQERAAGAGGDAAPQAGSAPPAAADEATDKAAEGQ
jgi:tetratricopeptide (TPR) repeat protein